MRAESVMFIIGTLLGGTLFCALNADSVIPNWFCSLTSTIPAMVCAMEFLRLVFFIDSGIAKNGRPAQEIRFIGPVLTGLEVGCVAPIVLFVF
jgi:hypothetical protein